MWFFFVVVCIGLIVVVSVYLLWLCELICSGFVHGFVVVVWMDLLWLFGVLLWLYMYVSFCGGFLCAVAVRVGLLWLCMCFCCGCMQGFAVVVCLGLLWLCLRFCYGCVHGFVVVVCIGFCLCGFVIVVFGVLLCALVCCRSVLAFVCFIFLKSSCYPPANSPKQK